MSILERVQSFFGMSDEEDIEMNGYQEEEKNEEYPSVTNRINNPTSQNNQPTRQSFYQRSVANRSRDYSSQQSQEERYNNQSRQYHTQAQNVVSMQQSRASKSSTKPRSTRETHANKIIIIEPRAYSEAMKIAKHIMNGESVLVNFHQIEEYQARRIVDFLTGTVYAENGDIKRVGNEIFLCTAQGVEIDGTAQSLMDANMLEIQ